MISLKITIQLYFVANESMEYGFHENYFTNSYILT